MEGGIVGNLVESLLPVVYTELDDFPEGLLALGTDGAFMRVYQEDETNCNGLI